MIGVNGVRFGLRVVAPKDPGVQQKYQDVLADLQRHAIDPNTRGTRIILRPGQSYHRDQLLVSVPGLPRAVVKKMPAESKHHWAHRALKTLQKAISSSKREEMRELHYLDSTNLNGALEFPNAVVVRAVQKQKRLKGRQDRLDQQYSEDSTLTGSNPLH